MANKGQDMKALQDKSEISLKWHGKLKMVINCPIDKTWDISGDFCNLHRWVDTTESCECVEGEPQKPGCVRAAYGEGTFPRADGAKTSVREKLLTFDNESRSMSYIMLENNLGLSNYIATFILHDLGAGAVLVEWSYEVDPHPGSTEQKTADYMTGAYKNVLKKLEALMHSQGLNILNIK
ncbi:hypothetical protein R1sor_026125 [Riccia sorocarpa]|uniref:Uncharacterized protein n=1 Tax=Riccia sorocarpa TaxID=122646 RepID=A0ABD3GDB1_9MARC